MNHNKIKYSYDKELNSLYIYTSKKYAYEESIELNPNVIMDFDNKKTPVAVELLSASKLFKIDKYNFNNIKNLNVLIKINEDIIKLTIILTIHISEESIKQEFDCKCINNLSAPNINTELGII